MAHPTSAAHNFANRAPPTATSNRPVRVLLIEDDQDDYILTRDLLNEIDGERFDIEWVPDYEGAHAALVRQEHDVYLLDYRLGDHSGIEFLREAEALGCQAPVIVLTGQGSRDVDLEAMQAGAAYYLAKARIDAPLLERTIRYALQLRQVEDQVRRLNAELEERVHERTTQLEAANQELEAFSYSVSHDLRAPLRGISGFSKALMEDYAAQLDEQGQHYLKRINAAATRMGDLIADLLSLARVTRTEMTYRAVDLSALAQDILAELRNANPDRRIDLIVAPNITARGDALLLRTVMENLLGNAWKYTGKQPSARIEFGVLNAEFGIERVGPSASDTLSSELCALHSPVFFVRDDGAGFDMKYAARLFGAFQRLHNSREFEGTGVGLATVQRIVRRHGGRVWAEAAVGRGATFYFTLPPV
ncbi:MAG: response regulator [Deltaproteobacteria bacterium]|nr:response regulator [Deltaproteobacteria bacterium]MBI3386968.1 response regulator [Deltaproteobacteria bacterium]